MSAAKVGSRAGRARRPGSPRTTAGRRWVELGGELPARPIKRRLRSGLERLALAPVVDGAVGQLAAGAAGGPLVVVTVRRRRGKGCDQQAEIGGFYSGPGGAACIGQAAVKALLDAAAQQLCCKELNCPRKCPCLYVPQATLALYRCGAVEEEGYLLQGDSTFNCRCQEDVMG